MVASYRLDATADAIAAALGADPGRDVWQGGAIVPGDFAPVVVRGKDRARHLVPRLWGVPPPPRSTHPVTHVRHCDSPFWIGNLRHSEYRALVPATAFRTNSAWFGVEAQPVFVMAGVWRDSEVPGFALLSVAGDGLYPAEHVKTLPVILRPADYAAWLAADWSIARDLVSAGRMPLVRIGP